MLTEIASKGNKKLRFPLLFKSKKNDCDSKLEHSQNKIPVMNIQLEFSEINATRSMKSNVFLYLENIKYLGWTLSH